MLEPVTLRLDYSFFGESTKTNKTNKINEGSEDRKQGA
jgi:hypothetical protein